MINPKIILPTLSYCSYFGIKILQIATYSEKLIAILSQYLCLFEKQTEYNCCGFGHSIKCLISLKFASVQSGSNNYLLFF